MKAGAAVVNLSRAIGVGAAAYGTKIMGMPCYLLQRLRSSVRACTSTKASGSSATLDLMLQRSATLDPTYRANTEPL
eukprot:12410860-Karenia_brevis.AAC.1